MLKIILFYMYVLLILITCLKLIFNVWKYCKKIINNRYYDIFKNTDCMLILILFIYKSYLEWKKYNYFKIPENLEKYLNTYILKTFSINLKSILDNNQNPVFCGPLSEKLSNVCADDWTAKRAIIASNGP